MNTDRESSKVENKRLCWCGCGQVKGWNYHNHQPVIFVRYHSNGGKNNPNYGKNGHGLECEQNPMWGKNHTPEAKKKISDACWNGGKYISTKGYVYVYNPNHPRASNKYVFEHILVMEKHICRYRLRGRLSLQTCRYQLYADIASILTIQLLVISAKELISFTTVS